MLLLQKDIGVMRLLHLVHRSWPYHGGAERYVLEHAFAGSRWGHESVICTSDAWDMSWLVSRSGVHIDKREDNLNGVRIKRFPVLHPPFQNLLRGILRRISVCGPDRYFYPNPFIPSLHRWLSEDQGFDFVHANAMPFMLQEGWRYSSRFGTGLASVPHANVGEKYRRVNALHYFRGCQEKILRNSTFVVAQSGFEKTLYLDMGIPEERVHVSGSGIDPAEFTKSNAERGRNRLGACGRIILSLTAHSLDRGTAHIIEACRALIKKREDFTLVLAGPILPDAEMYIDSLEDLTAEFSGRIITTGYFSQDERADLISAADMVILPSRLDCFGIVLLEGWVSRKPVIGCWSGAMPDMISDGMNGFLVSWGDTATLSDRIEILLDNAELSHGMGENGRRLVLERWTWDRITDRFYRRLSECCPGSGRV
jgi:glycosyltransferase involved in cell wall biosynthesis